MLITVERFTEPWEAHLFRMRLEAEDIPAFVVHEYHIWVLWPYSRALGGVKVQVHAEHYDEARKIWWACANGQFQKLLEERFGDLDGIPCPFCSSLDLKKSPAI